MKNRPLLSVCLMVLCIIASMVVWGRERFIKELRPSPIERYAAEGDSITICGKVYRQEQKENCRMIYLKENSIYSNSKKFQESKIIIYTNSSQKLHIGNQIKVCGKVSFYEEARNPGNFDQKFYYQKQGIHGKVRSDDIQITDYKRNKLKDRLEKFRMNWQKMLCLFKENGMGYRELAVKIKNGYSSLKRDPVFKCLDIIWNQKLKTAEISVVNDAGFKAIIIGSTQNLTTSRGYMYLFYTNDSKVLFPSVKEIIRRLKIVASGERLTDQDAEYFDWEEYGSLEMQRIYFSEIIKREAKTT